MSFLFPSLLAIGLPLIAVPVLIHLINLRRQQKIRWAAMQFLVESERQNKRWILFKQWLLLATRMAAIAVLILLLAHVVVRNEWLRLLGTGTTHHVILVDDSYSISDRWENTSALGEAKRAVEAIVEHAHQQSDSQLVTLLRFSEAARLSAGAQPEVFAQRVDDNFRSKLAALLAGWEPSQTDVGAADALKAIPRLPLAGEDQTVILYLVSDFRSRQFASATDVRKQLEDMKEEVAQIHLVRCVEQARPNLAITSLEPESGVRAAGVETWMNVTVANYGDEPASGILVQLEQDGDALPSLSLDQIPAGKEITKKFRVQFAGVGGHWLSAALEPDAVDVDNRRYFACQLPAARPVLVIDGSADGRGGRQLSLALDPGGNTHTGWSPHVEPATYLARTKDLSDQAAIVLMDVAKLQDDELAALEKHVENGGGVAWFVGSQTNRDFYNERLYRDGAGVFPVPLALPTQLLDSRHDTTADVVVGDHALFRALAGRRNGFLPLVTVDYYYALADDWTPPTDGTVNVLARLRNGAPLVVDKKFGKGRVVAQLTKLSTGDTPLGRWTNWSLNPVFPVLANELVAFLAAGQQNSSIQLVGDDLVVRVPEEKYDPAFRFLLPGDGTARPELLIDATADAGQLTAKLENVRSSGIYEVQLQPLEGPPERRAFAFNVPTGEGDLHITSREDLTQQLSGVDFQLHDAAGMSIDQQQLAGVQLGDASLGTLIVVLLVEQVLSYIASFHAPPAAGSEVMILFAAPSAMIPPTESGPGRVVYELGRLREFDDVRLPVMLIALGTAAILLLVWYLYRRDTRELSRGVGLLLAGLRFVAMAGLLVYFLGVERRTTRDVVHNSQVAVLVDVSQSMALSDDAAPQTTNKRSRVEQVVDALEKTPLMSELRLHHDVNVSRFDQEVQPVVSLPKDAGLPTVEGDATSAAPTGSSVRLASDATEEPATAANGVPSKIDWKAELEPRGTQTRLGDALDDQLYRYRTAPLAGVIVISDGVQNAGTEPSAAIAAAREAGVPVYTIGVGSTEPRRNLAVSDLLVPARAFPGDTVSIVGYLQATGFEGRFVDVELLRRTAEEPTGSGTSIASERVQIGADGKIIPVSFEIEPDAPGRFVYQVRAAAPPEDDNARDNGRESEMDVVDRQTRVLLVASGPTREYRFLRDQLHRDHTMKTDVLLQTAQTGMSQDADSILSEFPSTRDELYQYDCIVAFDPDWTQLDAAQVELLEKWIADEAGGLIAVPGPIHTAEWVRSVEHAKLRDLYPVVFQQRLTLLDDGHFGGEVAYPLVFERAGRDARFLWLANSAEESELAWTSFPGVFGYYAIKGEKPGATVYARVADPEAGTGDKLPVYMAGQFYGAGQVLYIGSGEFWRLRALDPGYFETLFTKLVRQVSQGRLLRGSSRGTLLVDRDRYELGETVVLRGRLSDERHEPLTVENVTAQVIRPDNSTDTVKLTADAQQSGMYVGQFVVRQEGTYQVALPVPGSQEEPFSKFIQVRVPDLERVHPERNVPLLTSLAKDTGGRYYPRLELAAYGDAQTMSLGKAIPSRAEVKLLKGAPDKQFAKMQMTWLLGVIAGALFIEWIVRRLNRLA